MTPGKEFDLIREGQTNRRGKRLPTRLIGHFDRFVAQSGELDAVEKLSFVEPSFDEVIQ